MTISPARMQELAHGLAEAKSRQHAEEALAFYHEQIELIAPSVGAHTVGKDRVRAGLNHFFKLLPDYEVRLEQFAFGDALMMVSGVVSATPNVGEGASRASVPVFIEFHYRDDLIAKEIFHLDMGLLCRKAGVGPVHLSRTAG